MRLTITIDTENDAFQQDGDERYEAARIVRELATDLLALAPQDLAMILRDINGNTVGHAIWSDDDPAPLLTEAASIVEGRAGQWREAERWQEAGDMSVDLAEQAIPELYDADANECGEIAARQSGLAADLRKWARRLA